MSTNFKLKNLEKHEKTCRFAKPYYDKYFCGNVYRKLKKQKLKALRF